MGRQGLMVNVLVHLKMSYEGKCMKNQKKTNHDLLRFFFGFHREMFLLSKWLSNSSLFDHWFSYWWFLLRLPVRMKNAGKAPIFLSVVSERIRWLMYWRNTLFFIRVCISFLFCAIDCIFCEKKLPRVTNEQCHKATNIHFLTTMQKAFLLDVFISESRIFEEKAIFRGFLHLGIW